MFHIQLISLTNRKNKLGKFITLQSMAKLLVSLQPSCDLVSTGFYRLSMFKVVLLLADF